MIKKCTAVLVAVAALAAALVSPAGASAHNTTWYWTVGLAEHRLNFDYSITNTASCVGWGKRIRRDHNWMYRHFDCTMRHAELGPMNRVLHVTGRNTYELLR
jgi:hypothetical protein